MAIEIAIEGADSLEAYASIPIFYKIAEVLDPDSPADSGQLLPYVSNPLAEPIIKDYDALPGNSPLDWPMRFDVSDWGFLAAYEDAHRVGGAVVLTRCSDIEMLDGRDDLALLWDIRVAPHARGRGIGRLLIGAAEQWAKSRDVRVIKVETQNDNVPACRFYARQGFALRAVNRAAYPDFPDEVQFLWYKDLV